MATTMECDEQKLLTTLDQLPMVLLTQIVASLGIDDQRNFGSTCRVAKTAVHRYWTTRTELHIGSVMLHTFPYVSARNYCSLYAVRKEVALALRLMPKFALRSICFEPVCAIHVQDLQDIECLAKKSAKEIYGALKHLDLRGCSLEYDELKYFSNACSRLTSIAITHSAVFLPDELFISDIKQGVSKEIRPLADIHNFLRISLPNFTEMAKSGKMPAEHIDVLAKLLKLFPYLEKFKIN